MGQAPRALCIVLTIGILAGCTSSKTEREQYEEATSGLKYNTYKTASKVAVVSSVEAYNYQQPDSAHIQPVYAHLLLGYFWSVSGKTSFAFAEAEITESNSQDTEDINLRFLAQTLRAITMYQAGWHELAKEESANAKQNLSSKPGSNATYEAATFYLIMGTLHAKEKDFAQAKFFWAGFGTETGIHWPYQICDAAADFQAGKAQEGLRKVKVISQDPAVPKPIRDSFAVEIAKIEKHAGTSVDSSLFWPKLIGGVIWDELKTSSNQSVKHLTQNLEDIRKKLPA